MAKWAAEHMPKQEVGYEDPCHDRQDSAPAASRGFDHNGDEERANDNAHLARKADQLLKILDVEIDVSDGNERCRDKAEVDHPFKRRRRSDCAVEEDEYQHECQMDCLVLDVAREYDLRTHHVVGEHGEADGDKRGTRNPVKSHQTGFFPGSCWRLRGVARCTGQIMSVETRQATRGRFSAILPLKKGITLRVNRRAASACG